MEIISVYLAINKNYLPKPEGICSKFEVNNNIIKFLLLDYASLRKRSRSCFSAPGATRPP